MLSDEEKEALERIDYIQDFIIENGQYNADVNDMEYFSRIVNLIEKQSKEIEELKLRNEALGDITIYNQKNSVSKDKIKAKIEELQDDIKYSANPLSIDNSKFGIKVLQSLLEKEEIL